MTEDQKNEFVLQLLIGKKNGGRLDEWGKHAWQGSSYIGIISNDSSGRFNDGTVVTTSRAVKIHTHKGQKILETGHSYYYLDDEGTEAQLRAHYDFEGVKDG